MVGKEEKKQLLHAACTLTSVHRANFREQKEDIELKKRSTTKREKKKSQREKN